MKLKMLYGNNFSKINNRAYITKSTEYTRVYLDDMLIAKLQYGDVIVVAEEYIIYNLDNRHYRFYYKTNEVNNVNGWYIKQFDDGRCILLYMEIGIDDEDSTIYIEDMKGNTLASIDDGLTADLSSMVEDKEKEYKNGLFYVYTFTSCANIGYAYIDMNNYTFHEYRRY